MAITGFKQLWFYSMPHPEPIDQNQMRSLLREAYGRDPEKSLLARLTRSLRDPSTSGESDHHLCLHPLWLTLSVTVAVLLIIFLCFSAFQP